MESVAEKILDCEEIKPGVYKCCFVSLERLGEAFMGQRYTKKEEKLSKRIFSDDDYDDAIKSTDLHEKMKKIISEHGPFTGAEIDVFVEENLNRPVLEEIFNDFKDNEDIRHAMEKYGVTTVHPIMPHLIFLEFFAINENLLNRSTKVMESIAEKFLARKGIKHGVYKRALERQKLFEKIAMDEIGCDQKEAKKAFFIGLKKMKDLDPNLPIHEFADKFLGKFSLNLEDKKAIKDAVFALDPNLSTEEAFRKGFQIGKEVFRIEEKQH